jgi:WD40 repeat protein
MTKINRGIALATQSPYTCFPVLSLASIKFYPFSCDCPDVPLNGVVLSGFKGESRFDGSVISNATLLPQGHSDFVNSAIYSEDGRRVLSASDDNIIKEWDRETGECLRAFEIGRAHV